MLQVWLTYTGNMRGTFNSILKYKLTAKVIDYIYLLLLF
jgi:hypothetical protein